MSHQSHISVHLPAMLPSVASLPSAGMTSGCAKFGNTSSMLGIHLEQSTEGSKVELVDNFLLYIHLNLRREHLIQAM